MRALEDVVFESFLFTAVDESLGWVFLLADEDFAEDVSTDEVDEINIIAAKLIGGVETGIEVSLGELCNVGGGVAHLSSLS